MNLIGYCLHGSICDFYFVRRQVVNIEDLYLEKKQSIYYYRRGFNLRAAAALACAVLLPLRECIPAVIFELADEARSTSRIHSCYLREELQYASGIPTTISDELSGSVLGDSRGILRALSYLAVASHSARRKQSDVKHRGAGRNGQR